MCLYLFKIIMNFQILQIFFHCVDPVSFNWIIYLSSEYIAQETVLLVTEDIVEEVETPGLHFKINLIGTQPVSR